MKNIKEFFETKNRGWFLVEEQEKKLENNGIFVLTQNIENDFDNYSDGGDWGIAVIIGVTTDDNDDMYYISKKFNYNTLLDVAREEMMNKIINKLKK